MVDLIIFMGQSNMAGRGTVTELFPEKASELIEGAGYEYRAISSPNQLQPLKEPFGETEDRSMYIDDGKRKTGSLVTSFVNSYYQKNGNIPVVAVSASKGGSSIREWNEIYTQDAVERLQSAFHYLQQENIPVRHCFMVWCQGETDADQGMEKEEYYQRFEILRSTMLKAGIEKIFLIPIGQVNSKDEKWQKRYEDMISWQDEIPQNFSEVWIVSKGFRNMKKRGLMKDTFHYYQKAYNEIGTEAGLEAAKFARFATKEITKETIKL